MASYHNANANSPYGSGDPYYNESSGYITPMPVKKGTSKWVKLGIPVAIVIIVGAVVGGVLGSRASNNKSSSVSGGSSSGSSGDQAAAASSAASVKNAIGVYPTGTDSQYLVPLYPSTTNSAAFTSPTFHRTSNNALAWPADTFKPSNPSVTNLRPDRPRIIAPAYKWQALPALIANDPYLKQWNDTIFGNATDYYNLPPVQYFMDGSSGILDNCRYVKQRVKAFAYAYRMTNDTKWVDRTWSELQNAVGDSFGPNNATKWNPAHFLDTAEMTAAFGIAYDWLHDKLTDDQKSTLRDNIITYGLSQGLKGYQNSVSGDFSGWWAAPTTLGNWNCVCNDGMTIGALAILGDDTTDTAEQILALSVPNALKACVNAVTSDGTWAETGNYWYFGTTGHAEMSSALMTATGDHLGMLTENPSFNLTGVFHMYGFGPGSLFDWGDHGPNKYTATANSMMLYGDFYERPEYVLFQRDRQDAAEPFSMFWYNPTVSGAFWDGLALDHFFDDDNDQWASMRSSWTDEDALYIAIKAGQLQNHQNHNDLDVGDFVLDAMGVRWAGELGSADYNSPDYFNGDGQNAPRWTYYRKATEGQNTVLINKINQNVNAQPKLLLHDSTGEKQGSSTVFDVPDDSTAFWTADTTSAYNDTSSAKRGIRMLNKRRQVLLQDEITSTQAMQWRMHTNATVTVDANDGTSATLKIGDKTLQMKLLSPSGASFARADPVRFQSDPATPDNVADPLNPTVSVVTIDLAAGTQNIQVLFSPQWDGMAAGDFVTPPSVALDQWSLKSHN